jgi:HSP20 family protein
MTALSLLNRNLDSDFHTPFFTTRWLRDLNETNSVNSVQSQMTFNEKSSAWELTLEVAGVTKDKLKVDVKEGHLSLSGEKTKGLSKGLFEKYYKIPDGVDIEKIEATFEDGVLLVTLPLQAAKETKTIPIK